MKNAIIAERHQLQVGITIRLAPVATKIFRLRLDRIKKNCRQLSGNLDFLRLQILKKDTCRRTIFRAHINPATGLGMLFELMMVYHQIDATIFRIRIIACPRLSIDHTDRIKRVEIKIPDRL